MPKKRKKEKNMKKKLIKNGSGWAVFMPKTILELLDLNPEIDQIELEVENKTLKISKVITDENK